ncbi:MAG: autotransporter domain-containing protein [Pseudoxanthomonas sp.]
MRIQRSAASLAAALALALAAAAPQARAADTFSQTVFFGDSLTDSGHFRLVLVQLAGSDAAVLGRFTTNPGLVWSEDLARYYGTTSDATSDNQGGLNYAVGGALASSDTTSSYGAIPSITTQVTSYLTATGGTADPDALYTVWIGANDLFAIVAGADATTTLSAAITGEVTAIAALEAAGARYVLVPNIPDLGITPSFIASGTTAQATGTALATSYNSSLYSALAAAGIRVIPLDTFSLLDEIAASPAQYGFTNVTSAACGTVSSLICVPSDYVDASAASTYLFADGVHPSTAAHAILAQYAESVLEGPRYIAALPHAAVGIGQARAELVAQHAEDLPVDASGTRWWGNLRADSQRQGDGAIYKGIVPGSLFGVDWYDHGAAYGVFAGYGRGKQDFGGSGGSFKESDASLGGYAGWNFRRGGWLNAQASYTWLGYDVDRQVPLGPVTRHHAGSPDGSAIAAGVQGGFLFGDGGFRHGPVAGVLAQKVEIDGYAENNYSATALSYPDQKLDSVLASLGWQLRFDASEGFAPYARLSWNHEFKNSDEEAWATLQTIPDMPYAVPGLEFDRDYATVLLGARMQLGGLGADVGLRSVLAQSGGRDASLFVGLSATF